MDFIIIEQFLTSLITMFVLKTINISFAGAEDYDKLNKFEKSMGKPNIYFNEDGHLVLLVNIYNGRSNRVVDSGLNSVGIQLRDVDCEDLDSNLISYLSQVLKVNKDFFTVRLGDNLLKRVVTIHDENLKPYDVVDNLVAALEITAKEEPSALRNDDPQDIKQINSQENISLQEEVTRLFDWRN